MISIIVPVYKAENYLRRCIDSVLAQTYQNWELLLIDDGSPDNSGAICDEYATKDSRINAFHKQNGGVSSARNFGLEKVHGEWVTFVDADDWLLQDCFEKAINTCAEADVIVQGYREIKMQNINVGGKEILPLSVEGIYTGTQLASALALDYVPHFQSPWAKLIKRDLIINNNLRFDNKMFLGEDTRFNFDCLAHAQKIAFTHYAGYCYNLCEDSSSKYKMTQEQVCYNINETRKSYASCINKHGLLAISRRWERQSAYVHLICYKRWVIYNGLNNEHVNNVKAVLTNKYIRTGLFSYYPGDSIKRRLIYIVYDLMLFLRLYKQLFKVIIKFV